MRKIIKNIWIYLSKKNSYIESIYLRSAFLRTPFGLTIVNLIFQKLFRINSDVLIPVNFTSRVTAYQNIHHYNDKNTLLSFAVSGNTYIQAINGIEFGRNVLFAPGVKIISANHDFYNKNQSLQCNSIKIGNNVWIGANAVILPGVEIGDNCIVGAGSIVSKSFRDDNMIIAGNPARVIKKLSFSEVL